ncbi:MAG: DUF2283 domain-containing protein [Saprospiraceae bacterium]
MKVTYNQQLDIFYIRFNDEKIAESDSEKPGVVLDFDGKGSIVAIEILNASKKMPQPTKFEYEIA